MRSLILNQIAQAFSNQPGLDGTLHGKRRIKQGKHGSRASLFYSAKNQAFIPVESRFELSFCYELEANKRVYKYRAQALEIPYRSSQLYPDFLIVDTEGTPFVREVKAFAHIDSAVNMQKAEYLMATFGRVEIDFDVVTERDFWSGQEKINRIMVYNRGGRLSPSSQLITFIAELVSAMDIKNRIVHRVRDEIQHHNLPHYLLEAAICDGVLQCDMRLPISAQTRLEVVL